MGLLKKIFKPVSKVLDKIVPNEIKPFLPYAAAFAPMIAPGIMGAFGNTMLSRAGIGGALNVFGQLSQEGNEGDINLLSAGLGALTGAMTGPNAASDFRAMQSANKLQDANITRTALQKAGDFGLEGLAKGSDIFAAGMKDPFSMAGLKAASLPAAQGTMDNMYAQAKRDQDAYDDMMSEDSEGGYTDDAYRAAIRKSMEAYGASEEEILSAIEAAGYKTGGRVGFKYGGGDIDLLEEMKEMVIAEPASIDEDQIEETEEGFKIKSKDIPIIVEPAEYDEDREVPVQFLNMKKGGRVGLRFGGIGAAVDQIDNQEMKEAAQFASMLNDMDVPIADLAEEFEIQFKRKPNSLEELKLFYKEKYDYKGPGDVKMQEEIKEKVVMGAKDGGLMNLGGKEMDLRKGGFVPIGKKERADDVPARLSKNEFVMTADAVRAAGGGSVNKGAKRMYETMNKLEARA